MKVSLVIPSTPNHFHYLDCIVQNYLNGTVKPDEIIISISNSHQIKPSLIENLEKKYDKIYGGLKILKHNRMVQEGPNRGEGTKISQYELISYHDSDDIPHPQRIEIIKYFFEKFDILHLNHSYGYETNFEFIEKNSIKFLPSSDLYNFHFGENNTFTVCPLDRFPNPDNKSYACIAPFWVCGGPTTIHRSVLEKVFWNEKRILSYDYDFCMEVLFTFKKSMVIDSKLIWYNKINDISWACN